MNETAIAQTKYMLLPEKGFAESKLKNIELLC